MVELETKNKLLESGGKEEPLKEREVKHCRHTKIEVLESVKHCTRVCGLAETTATGSPWRQPSHRPHHSIEPLLWVHYTYFPLRIRQKVFLKKPLFCLFYFLEQRTQNLNMQKFVYCYCMAFHIWIACWVNWVSVAVSNYYICHVIRKWGGKTTCVGSEVTNCHT